MNEIKAQANILQSMIVDLMKSIEDESNFVKVEKESYEMKVKDLEAREAQILNDKKFIEEQRKALELEKRLNREQTEDLAKKKVKLEEKMAKVNKFLGEE